MGFFNPRWTANYEGHEILIYGDRYHIVVLCDGATVAKDTRFFPFRRLGVSESVLLGDRSVWLEANYSMLGGVTLTIDSKAVPLTMA